MDYKLSTTEGVEKDWWWFVRVFDRGLLVVLGLPAVDEQDRDEVEQELMYRVNEVYFGSKEPQTVGGLMTIVNDEFAGVCGAVMAWNKNGGVGVSVIGQMGVKVCKKDVEGWLFRCDTRNETPLSARGSLMPGDRLVICNHDSEQEHDFIKLDWVFEGEAAAKELETELEIGYAETEKNKEDMVLQTEEEVASEQSTLSSSVRMNPLQLGRQKMAGVKFSDVGKSLKSSLSGLIKPDSQVTVQRKSWKKSGVLGVAVLVFLAGVFLVGRYKRAEEQRLASNEEKMIVRVVETFSQAKVLAKINGEEARLNLNKLERELESLTDEQKSDPRVAQILSEKGEVLGEATGVKKIDMAELVDLGLYRDDVQVSAVEVRATGGLLVLDGESGRILTVSEKGAVDVVRAKEGVETGKALVSSAEKMFVLTNAGVVECPIGKSGSCKQVIKNEGWKKAEKIKTWMGNLYVLDSEAGQIWKHTLGASGYSNANAWVSDESSENVSGAVDFDIDGNIWVLGKNGVLKFVSGKGERIQITDAPSAIGNEGGIEISGEGEVGYVWDKSNSRVMVWSKNGEYLEQWVNNTYAKSSLVIVDPIKKKVYAVEGQKIFVGEF